jgi:hypothetical protein
MAIKLPGNYIIGANHGLYETDERQGLYLHVHELFAAWAVLRVRQVSSRRRGDTRVFFPQGRRKNLRPQHREFYGVLQAIVRRGMRANDEGLMTND